MVMKWYKPKGKSVVLMDEKDIEKLMIKEVEKPKLKMKKKVKKEDK